MASLVLLILYALLIVWLGWWGVLIILVDLALGLGYFVYAARVLRQ